MDALKLREGALQKFLEFIQSLGDSEGGSEGQTDKMEGMEMEPGEGKDANLEILSMGAGKGKGMLEDDPMKKGMC